MPSLCLFEQKVDFNEIKRKQIEEKSKKKCQAFLDIVPTKKMTTIHENDIKTQGVNDSFDFNTEKTIDLGNIKTNHKGEARYTFYDNVIKLRGTKCNIIGRGLIIHQDEDDCGQGGNAESLKTGNAGKRGCYDHYSSRFRRSGRYIEN